MSGSWPRDEAKEEAERHLRERDAARRRHIIGGGSLPLSKRGDGEEWSPTPMGRPSRSPDEGIGE